MRKKPLNDTYVNLSMKIRNQWKARNEQQIGALNILIYVKNKSAKALTKDQNEVTQRLTTVWKLGISSVVERIWIIFTEERQKTRSEQRHLED